jgi:D-glycero-D-manno-heptose 1,7-bisphosphate phosphatase
MKLVILDRDGTINEDRDDFVKSADEWVPLPGALEAIARLNHAGWRVALATNQSGLGRGLFDMSALNAIHLKMNTALAQHGGRIDAVFFCPHAPDEQCACRKPLPGLLLEAGRRFGVDLRGVPMVGDSLRDLRRRLAAARMARERRRRRAPGDPLRQRPRDALSPAAAAPGSWGWVAHGALDA